MSKCSAITQATPKRASGLGAVAAILLSATRLFAADDAARAPLPQALSEADFANVLARVDRALAWLATKQEADGCFNTENKVHAQPGLTGLAVMAYLSRGHAPGHGPYGSALDRAIDFIVSCQKRDGFLCWQFDHNDHADTYNHAIALLMLGEVYGLTTGERSARVRQAIERGIAATDRLWTPVKRPQDQGGYRYLNRMDESDLSVTGWYALALRSVKNAGFDIPRDVMDRVANYVLRCYSRGSGGFSYQAGGVRQGLAMTGAGVLCLALAGHASHEAVRASAQTIVAEEFEGNIARWPYYTCYYVSQAGAQLGGETWVTIYRKTVAYLAPRQLGDGSFRIEGADTNFGPVLSTSMAVLALTPQLQLLPIYQH